MARIRPNKEILAADDPEGADLVPLLSKKADLRHQFQNGTTTNSSPTVTFRIPPPRTSDLRRGSSLDEITRLLENGTHKMEANNVSGQSSNAINGKYFLFI